MESRAVAVLDHVADFYRRYPGEVITLYSRVLLPRPASGLALRVALPPETELESWQMTPQLDGVTPFVEQDGQRQAEGDDRGFRPGFLRGGEGKWLVQSMTLPLRAKSPCGRFWMKRMISARMRILPSTAPICGSRILLAMPRPKAAKSHICASGEMVTPSRIVKRADVGAPIWSRARRIR